MTQDHFDLIVIGAGPAGEKGAAQAAYFGKRVCLIERAPKPGGTAVNTGALPSKALREAALHFSGLRQRALHGIDFTVKRDISIADFMHRERSVVETAWAMIEENLRRHEITVVQGVARFVSPRMIEVSRFKEAPRRLTADVFLIAAGAVPRPVPEVPVDGQVVVDSETLLRLPRIPQTMLVLGGDTIACEYACIFAALGTRVTVLANTDRLMEHVDAELGHALRDRMTGRLRISVQLGVEVAKVAVEHGHALVTLADGTVMKAEAVFHSGRRSANTEDLGLDRAGVAVDAEGFIEVDEHYRTNARHIFAAGDVIGFPFRAAVAMEQARVAICHAFDLKYKQRVSPLVPYAAYTVPEVAMVGETEETARAKGIDYEVGKASFRTNPRGHIVGDTDGFLKLIFRQHDQRLLGVAIIGEDACELIHVGLACLAFEGTIDFFIQGVFFYPTLSDSYKYAAYDGLQRLARRVARTAGLPTARPPVRR